MVGLSRIRGAGQPAWVQHSARESTLERRACSKLKAHCAFNASEDWLCQNTKSAAPNSVFPALRGGDPCFLNATILIHLVFPALRGGDPVAWNDKNIVDLSFSHARGWFSTSSSFSFSSSVFPASEGWLCQNTKSATPTGRLSHIRWCYPRSAFIKKEKG